MRITFGTHVVARQKQPSLAPYFKGLCSHYLDRVQERDTLGMFVRTSQFRLPKVIKNIFCAYTIPIGLSTTHCMCMWWHWYCTIY